MGSKGAKRDQKGPFSLQISANFRNYQDNLQNPMDNIKLSLDRRRMKKDGTYPIKIHIGWGYDTYLSTGIFIFPDEWDPVSNLIISPEHSSLNRVLESMKENICQRMKSLRLSGALKKLDRKELKKMLENFDLTVDEVKKASSDSVGSVFDRVIALKKGRTAELYKSTLKKVQAFCDPYRLSFDDITRLWLLDFEAANSDLAINTLSIHMRNIRFVVNFAIDSGITSTYGFRGYKIRNEETVKRALPIDQMRYFLNCDHLDKYHKTYRDMFMLSFYLIGINMVDMSRLTRDNIQGDRLVYRRTKTGKIYDIRIEPEAAELIRRYQGKDHLLECFDRYSNYRAFNKKMSDGLRRIGPLEERPVEERRPGRPNICMKPINTEVSSYWARHSWATYAYNLGISIDTISEALGHQHGSPVTGIYIKTNLAKVDEANRKVIDYVFGKLSK